MNESDVKKLFAFVSDIIDIENIPLDDQKTYDLLAGADTDGVFWLESEWDKYDLRQIQPANFDELTACIAFGFSQRLNPYIYTYMKIRKVQRVSYPCYEEIEAVKDILKDSHGMLLYKEQAAAITDYIANMSAEDRVKHDLAIKILTQEIEKRKDTLANRTFSRNRALFCYRNAYIKANFSEEFNCFLKMKQLHDYED